MAIAKLHKLCHCDLLNILWHTWLYICALCFDWSTDWLTEWMINWWSFIYYKKRQRKINNRPRMSLETAVVNDWTHHPVFTYRPLITIYGHIHIYHLHGRLWLMVRHRDGPKVGQHWTLGWRIGPNARLSFGQQRPTIRRNFGNIRCRSVADVLNFCLVLNWCFLHTRSIFICLFTYTLYEVAARTGLGPLSDLITRRQNSVFGHTARLPEDMLVSRWVTVGRWVNHLSVQPKLSQILSVPPATEINSAWPSLTRHWPQFNCS